MLRPYPCATLDDSPRQSVPGVLRDQWIRVDLRLWNRHQDAEIPRRPGLELPGERVLPVADQILPPLPLAVELEQALVQDQVPRDGPRQRGGHRGRAGPYAVQRVEHSRTSRRDLVQR